VLTNGQWKIDAPISSPHVDWKTAINYIRKLQKNEPSRSAELESIIRNIEKARKQIHKKAKANKPFNVDAD
jgi:hypothetical protein